MCAGVLARCLPAHEHPRDGAGHPLVAERPIDVAGAAVGLQLDCHQLEAASELGQQFGEPALDRAERAVEQQERRAFAMALVVQL